MRFSAFLVAVTAAAVSGCGNSDTLGRVYPALLVCRTDGVPGSAGTTADCSGRYDLGALAAGERVTVALEVRNEGRGRLEVSSVELDGAIVTAPSLPARIEGFASVPWPIDLRPGLGPKSTVITVVSNDRRVPRYDLEILYDGQPCVSGSARLCGSDVGACQRGTQTCVLQVWSECVGEIRPGAESCNGLDDDCNGATDDAPTGVDLCDDGLFCTGTRVCDGGGCVPVDVPLCADPTLFPELNSACTVGVCDEASHECVLETRAEGTACNDGSFCTTGETCAAGSCTGGTPLDCSGLSDACNDGVCSEGARRCVQQAKPSCECDATVDADFDGFDQCQDCDDRNGAVYDGAPELCNGVDDDCDASTDEDFDGDGDTYTTCGSDPRLFDCDDDVPTVHPGAGENCDDGLGTETGNGVDDDCDGYTDEGCKPCNAADEDGDTVAECDGDCAPTDSNRFPGNQESCDGIDNDCNIFTVDNCGVSDSCNQDGDLDFSNDADLCREDLICACLLGANNRCDGNHRCTSFCNASKTGDVGDLCAPNEVCALSLVRSANVHGCQVVTATPGTAAGGEPCGRDSDCRSNACDVRGPSKICVDYCTSDTYCTGANTVCGVFRNLELAARCYPVGRALVGTTVVGGACDSDFDCDHGLCTTDGAERYCTAPCCNDVDCPDGFHCSLAGEQVDTIYVLPSETGPSCSGDGDCPDDMVCYLAGSVCAWRMTETAPMCLRDVAGQDSRRAGAACTDNADCISGFCDRTSSTCIEPCCHDGTCPIGLSCELQLVETTLGHATSARICVPLPSDELVRAK